MDVVELSGSKIPTSVGDMSTSLGSFKPGIAVVVVSSWQLAWWPIRITDKTTASNDGSFILAVKNGGVHLFVVEDDLDARDDDRDKHNAGDGDADADIFAYFVLFLDKGSRVLFILNYLMPKNKILMNF